MYQHPPNAHSLYDPHNHNHPQSNQQSLHPQPNPEQDFANPRQQPPSIHTDILLYPSDSANYSPSPASSPSDNPVHPGQPSGPRPLSFPQPMSAPHAQHAFPPRYEHEPILPRFPLPNQTLDRRMSEPVLGAGRPTYAQPPPPSHHDTFAYSAASSATMIQPSPLSPRPSSSYSSYGSYPSHERDDSAASAASAGMVDSYAHPAVQFTALPFVRGERGEWFRCISRWLTFALLAIPPVPFRPIRTNNGAPPAVISNKFQHPAYLRKQQDVFLRVIAWERGQEAAAPTAYGTLNHLNAHVTMQRHGQKRSPNEFKELRKQWRLQKKEQEEQERERERETAQAQAIAMREMQQYTHHAQMAEYDHRHFRRRLSMVEPYPDPHMHSHSLPGHSYLHGAMHGQAPSGQGQVQNAYGGQPQSAPSYTPLQGPGMGMEARYGLPSPADEMAQFRYSQPHASVGQGLPSLSLAHHTPAGQEDDIYFRNPGGAAQSIMPQSHGEPVGPSWDTPHLTHQHAHPATPIQHHQTHGVRHLQPFYTSSGANSSITLPPPHALGSLSVSAPNPSPLSQSAFPSLGSSTVPGPSLGSAQDVSLAGLPASLAPGAESGSPTPELAAHVSLGSNRLPPDSTLLTPLPGYQPDIDRGDAERVHDDFDRERLNDYARDRDDRERGRGRERYYGGTAQSARDLYE
ncbi:hypothetical protein BN946_scf184783.g26 [Trametes cinnabarina]|uniref:Uncharacterized protein n=1 Tax=Pycnoporus cinnabarinus TaxID=5643 RepID=A0A060S6N2_PYCCI|nr:hypothetical protein BN946_scf184783.g26 [Trametes cinnabarina]